MKYLVTGAAGFIGARVCERLCEAGFEVVGIDNLNDYYDVSLKQARLQKLADFNHFQFQRLDLADREAMAELFAEGGFKRVIHLGAQAGVRYSIENPYAYADSNLVGTLTVLEGCRHHGIEHLVYASSSSVYGLNKKMPFATTDSVDHPVSFYAATKKANEMMAHSYAHLYGLPTTGLRFFTVYGPWGRPDMAPMLFADAITSGRPIKVFNQGDMSRDFTFIDDIVEGIIRVADKVPKTQSDWTVEQGTPATSSAPYRVYNIGNGSPVRLLDFISELEAALGQKAEKILLPMQDGDVQATWADTEDLFKAVAYKPQVGISEGVKAFADWFKRYYKK
ncbi:NAD-dependent epimerase [Shewanella algae]|uniref:NAD-dependent epimerase n=1 Tax=Shewanella algae TaxID=38313 RepID=UPI001AADFD3C|nr:NAD-dependent epimerase [Shewanella algae]MBO2564638.1 NAD-dependent epimerase [Shewanella algae]MBO2611458.1 NAD-dependent epimerase [Shewanella algae]